jgi:hypothetical protein
MVPSLLLGGRGFLVDVLIGLPLLGAPPLRTAPPILLFCAAATLGRMILLRRPRRRYGMVVVYCGTVQINSTTMMNK